MKDPYLQHIVGLMAVGMASTALAVSGYLHQTETFRFLGAELTYQAAYRKLPLSMAGAGFTIAAWLLTQERRDWRQRYSLWERQQLAHQAQYQALQQQADLQGYQQLAQLQTAEKFYPALAPYLGDVQDAEYQEVSDQSQQATSQPQAASVAPGQAPPPVTPAYESTADITAYLQNFLEYPGLLFGGMGAGKSWTARYLVMQKVRAGHQVVVLDPHAASHEWKGIRHIGAGMDYRAIADFLQWYLDEIERRYQEFNRSGLTEEDWQQSLRQQQRITSVVSEEMTNWADRLPGDIGSKFFKSAMSDSRKVLMPPLFVAHDRTLSALGDAKGIARLRDAALLELELIPTIHPTTRKPVSSGQGKLKLPGHGEWLPVELPKIASKTTDFSMGLQPATGEQQAAPKPQQTSQAAPQQADFRSQVLGWLGACWDAETTPSAERWTTAKPLSSLSQLAQELVEYMRRKDLLGREQKVRHLRQNWGASHKGLSADGFLDLLKEINTAGYGSFIGESGWICRLAADEQAG